VGAEVEVGNGTEVGDGVEVGNGVKLGVEVAWLAGAGVAGRHAESMIMIKTKR